MNRWVEVTFDCLPLRSVPRLDVPIDASPKLTQKILRVKQALQTHGTHNSYYLHNAKCVFHMTNDESVGLIAFSFEGTLLTDPADMKAVRCDLDVQLEKENCSWLNQAIVDWLAETVRHAVPIEFDRFIAAGDLKRTQERVQQTEKSLEDTQGFVGMYL